MGHLLKAICTCGYRSRRLTQGVGFRFDENGIFYEICYCDQCGTVDCCDGGNTAICAKCNKEMRFYHEQLPSAAFGEELGLRGLFYLNKSDWHCPKCKQQTLAFEFNGLWD